MIDLNNYFAPSYYSMFNQATEYDIYEKYKISNVMNYTIFELQFYTLETNKSKQTKIWSSIKSCHLKR